MQIPDSRIGFTRGMRKVVPPAQTFRRCLLRLSRRHPRLLRCHFRVKRPSGIPQTRFEGTDAFRRIVKANGTNGKGHCWDQAMASGIMEFAERYSCMRFLSLSSSFRWKPLAGAPGNPFAGERLYNQCIPGLHECVPPDRELGRIPVRWYRGWDLAGNRVDIPTGVLGFLMQGSNGMAGGNSPAEALVQGACEVIERHCATVIEHEKRLLQAIDPQSVTSPAARMLMRRFRDLGQSVQLRDCSLVPGIPAVGVVRRTGRRECVVTIGVASDPHEALVRGLTESSQAESSLMNRPESDCACFLAARPGRMLRMSGLACLSHRSLRVELQRIEAALRAAGMQLFFHLTTDSGLGIPGVIAVIAGAKCFNPLISRRNIYIVILEEYMQTGRFARARSLIMRFRRIDRKNAAAYDFYAAVLQMKLGKYAAGVRALERLGDDFRLPLMANVSLALRGCYYGCLTEKPDWDMAADRIQRLLRLDPDFRFELSWVYHRLRQRRDARTGQRLKKMYALVERLRSLNALCLRKDAAALAAGRQRSCLPW